MGYQVKWVEENLGVTRKALRIFEKKGLMSENKDRRYRNYSEEDIDRIWGIKLLQGIGYSLSEIVDLREALESEEFDFCESLERKIKELEREKVNIEKHLGYAKTIKLTGRFPIRPRNMGEVTFEEFQEKSLNEWNFYINPETQKYTELADKLFNSSDEELKKSDIGELIDFLQKIYEAIENTDAFFVEIIIPNEIIKRKERGAEDQEVQLLVKILYENRCSMFPTLEATPDQFAKFEASNYVAGDIARQKEKEYGKEGCLFIADAIAIFGGYSCYDEISEK